MQFTTLLIAAFASLAMASPLLEERTSFCGPLDTPQCCSLDVDTVLDLSCEAPSSTKSSSAFKKACAAVGKEAVCCVLPVDGDALICGTPSG